MYCKHCGNKLDEHTKFCPSCGKATHENHVTHDTGTQPTTIPVNNSNAIIKCGNCAYEGPGEKSRNIAFVVLAWLCVLFAPLVTIIYFLATAKWRCPQCHSTFLGVKNKEGKFAGQRNSSVAVIIIVILAAIVVIGILASVVLASLNSARIKGRDARRVSDVKQLQLGLELFYDANQTYPTALSQLSPTYINRIPTDPAGGAYTYSYCTTDFYHLGASLEGATALLEEDSDSTTLCIGDKVKGDDTQKCTASDVGNYCYDVTSVM